jgi:hypothetical protein
LKTVGDINDEGLWNHNARCKVLFGTFLPDEWNQGVVASPLFTWVQWLVFSVFGVSIASARIWPLVSLWLIMGMVYALMRRVFGTNRAILAVLMIGVLHEILFYAKWSTPIIPEACFLLAVFYFWELGRIGHPAWTAISAASLVAAVLTKLTAAHFIPALVLFMAASYWVREDVGPRRILWFLAGGLVVGTVAALYFALNYRQVQDFLQTVGRLNVNTPLGPWWQLPHVVASLPYKGPMNSPGAVAAMMLASLWAVTFIVECFQTGFRAAVKGISGLELYSVCWLLGCVPTLLLIPYRPERRFVMFLVPSAVLSAAFVLRAFEKRPAGEATPASCHGVARLPTWGKIALAVGLAVAWSKYAVMAIAVTNADWLQHAGATIPRLGLHGAVGTCILIATWYTVSSRRRYAVAMLLAAFFVINVLLNAIWYVSATYTVRDASRDLAARDPKSGFYIGYFCFELSLENRRLPIETPCAEAYIVNSWFEAESERSSYLFNLIDHLDLDQPLSREAAALQEAGVLKFTKRIPPDHVERVASLRLCPLPFHADLCRVEGTVYSVRNGPLPAAMRPSLQRRTDGT